MRGEVKIKGIAIPLIGNNRAILDFEKMSGKSFNAIDSHTDSLQFMYCSLKAGARKEGKSFSMTFDEFIDYIDQNPDALPQEEDGEPARYSKKK